ncbi:AMP-dependent synthetase/ligase [Maribellus mangrovi]|uniref:AMP-dependent synthetase/ligase n=1 Tax=Maribellus mangrovi TaxID=3133146 RepID=UPI0030EF3915
MKTIIELFNTSVQKYPDNVYLLEKKRDKYDPLTYSETHEYVLQMAAGLHHLGLKKGDRCGLVSDGQNAWIISELGILFAGAVNVPLSVKLTTEELRFRLSHSECKMIIVSKEHASKIEAVRNDLPDVEKIIFIDGKSDKLKGDTDYSEVLESGKEYLKSHSEVMDKIQKNVKPNDLANISYTSGTTANPKGIMLTHLNYVSNVIQGHTLVEAKSDWKTLAILPWDHAFVHTVGLYCFMYKGATVASVKIGKTWYETLKNVPGNIKEVKPTVLLSAPALAKNLRKNIDENIRQKGAFTNTLFSLALKISYAHNGLGYNKGKGLRFLLKPLLWFFDILLYKKIRKVFGGELLFFVGGAALLDVELQKYFFAIGIPMCQGYGLSEASPIISGNALHAIKFGSSGLPVKYMELKIVDDEGKELPIGQKGEIIIKGENVMLGYWKNPNATAETIKNGWLYTGDMGYLDEDGFLFVLGRFKSLLIGNDGEKYSPEGIEEALSDKSPFINQALLINNQHPYTAGMIVPDIGALNRELKKQKITPGTEEGNKATVGIIENEINKYKKGGKFETMFPQRWLPTSVIILPEGLTETNGLVNSTSKVIRGKVPEYFKKEYDFLFTPEAKNIFNKTNLDSLKKWNKK